MEVGGLFKSFTDHVVAILPDRLCQETSEANSHTIASTFMLAGRSSSLGVESESWISVSVLEGEQVGRIVV